MLQATNAARSETGVNRENLAFFMQPLPEMRAWMFSRETAKTENLLKCVPLLLSRRNNYSNRVGTGCTLYRTAYNLYLLTDSQRDARKCCDSQRDMGGV
ncbi:hypothetical protein PF008_g19862 [Phytophthora fragariae]|uniref:Uncharacterized protein n=1 Tax=Phytophthora fragariae TaxID=53985 RepID=A0A6G0R159_9STRA|nr:hypothetical protein PF008_g19862 [Phytophthora fragariae]